MLRSTLRRLIAALLALWLPLQLGTAFAVAAQMAVAGPASVGQLAADHGHRGHHEASAPSGCELAASHDHARAAAVDAALAPVQADCAASGSHDPAACVECAFCFASSVPLALAAAPSIHATPSGGPFPSEVERLDSLAQIPPDPPPIA